MKYITKVLLNNTEFNIEDYPLKKPRSRELGK